MSGARSSTTRCGRRSTTAPSRAGQQAGAVTYFAFLSFFPILALAFFVVGRVAKVYPDAQDDLVDGRQRRDARTWSATGTGQIRLSEHRGRRQHRRDLIGLIGLLYAGLGWLSAMRDALVVVFEQPAKEQPNFVIGKLRDLLSLVVIGVVLLVSVALAGFVTGFSDVRARLGRRSTPSSTGWSS